MKEATNEPRTGRTGKVLGRPKKHLDSEHRARREVANQNERRRMLCINSGFQCLRSILKQQFNCERKSKAAILHESVQYIRKLENDLGKTVEQNQLLKNFFNKNHQQQQLAQLLQSTSSNINTTATIRAKDNCYTDVDYRPSIKKQKQLDEKVKKLPILTTRSNANSDIKSDDMFGYQNINESTNELMAKEVSELKTLLTKEKILRQALEERQRGFQYKIRPELRAHLAQAQGQQNASYSNKFAIPQSSGAYRPIRAADNRPIDLQTKHFPQNMPNIEQELYYRYDQRIQNLSCSTPFLSWSESDLVERSNYYCNPINLKQKTEHTFGPKMFGQNNSAAIALPINMSFRDSSKDYVTSTTTPATSSSATKINQLNSIGINVESTSADDTGLRKNLEIILKAIQHIEGDEVFNAGAANAGPIEATNCMKQLCEKFDLNSNADPLQNKYLRHLLSNEYRVKKIKLLANSSTVVKPSPHNVNSLL